MKSSRSAFSCNIRTTKKSSDVSINNKNIRTSDFNVLNYINDLRRNSKQQKYTSFLDKITELNFSEKGSSKTCLKHSSSKANKTSESLKQKKKISIFVKMIKIKIISYSN